MPDIVRRAMSLAEVLKFPHSCTPETGRLLKLLVRQRSSGKVGEIGTGCGVGAAWMASGLAPSTQLFTIDLDPLRASRVESLLKDHPQVTVISSDWRQLAKFGPFDLLFVDVGDAKAAGAEDTLRMLKIGGLALLDDLTPTEQWPSSWAGKTDPVRDFWLNDPRLAATELRTTSSTAVILATRLE